MAGARKWTRAELMRAGAGAGLVVAGGGGYGLYRLFSGDDETSEAGVAGGPRFHRYRSEPDLRPPAVTIERRAGAAADGLLFLSPSSGPGQRGALIVDDTGEPVWFRPTPPVTTMNFRTAIYDGRPVLTWWQGTTERGLGEGTHVIVDDAYRVVKKLPAGAGRPSDLHEFLVTPRGTAIVTAWEVATADLRSVGGPRNGKVVGGLVQELELPSGRVLFEWRSLDHIRIDETHAALMKKAALDYFHINSVEPTADGNFLVSARNTWGIYKVDRDTGKVIWRLGGKRSDFRMGAGTRFAWQHDAREHGTRISLFDNGARPQVHEQSRALLLALDPKRMRATLERRVVHSPPLLAYALGSHQLLPNGNSLVGWGTAPYFTEVGAGGGVVLEGKLPRGGQNYRALRLPWSGRPAGPPRLAARAGAGSPRVYASWNGATEVASWQLRSGRSRNGLAAGATVPRRGFETALELPTDARYAAVVALDADGTALRTSATIAI
jgi:Arylsulfotransferase (ASST)